MQEICPVPTENGQDTKTNIGGGLKFMQGVLAGIGIGLVLANLVSTHFGLQGSVPDIVGGATGAAAMALLAKVTHVI